MIKVQTVATVVGVIVAIVAYIWPRNGMRNRKRIRRERESDAEKSDKQG